jgi:DNA-binding NtrC family response regulator
MTAYATVPTAVQAMREGAYDYVTKPFDPDELRAVVLRAVAEAGVIGPGRDARPRAERAAPDGHLLRDGRPEPGRCASSTG